MKEKMVYQCEFCHTEFNNKKDCQECEAFHNKTLRISGKRYLCFKNDSVSFPHIIIVSDKEGKTCEYRRVGMR